jgi:hypothetical protein
MASTTERDQIHAFMAAVSRAKEALQIEVPGWILRQPPIAEVEDQIAFIIADSLEGKHLPFVLPCSTAACVCVTKGQALYTDSTGATVSLPAPRFQVLSAGDHRQIVPLEHPTMIVCLFFRAEGMSGGFAVDSR